MVGAGQIGSSVFVLSLNRVLKKQRDSNCRDDKVVFLSCSPVRHSHDTNTEMESGSPLCCPGTQ